MKPDAIARFGKVCAAALLSGALVVLLTGCGNDNPAEGVTVEVSFPTASASSASQPMGISAPSAAPGLVKSVVVGALVLTHTSQPYTSANDVTDQVKQNIQDDAIQSARYFEVYEVPSNGTVTFMIPLGDAGNWVVAGLGVRYSISAVGQIEDLPADAPTYYGFAYHGDASNPQFLNDYVGPGDSVTLTMEPACAYTPNGLQDTTLCGGANPPPAP